MHKVAHCGELVLPSQCNSWISSSKRRGAFSSEQWIRYVGDAPLCLVWTECGHLNCQPHLWVFKPDQHLTPLVMFLAFLSYLAAADGEHFLSLSLFLSFTTITWMPHADIDAQRSTARRVGTRDTRIDATAASLCPR